MTFLAFLLGLALGIGVWLWQQRRLQKQLRQMLRTLPTDTSSTSLPLVSRLRSEMARAKQHREELEAQLQIRQRLFQIAPFGYLQVDEENRLLWCNEQARQLLQMDRWEPSQLRLLLEVVRSYELDQLIERTRQRQQPDISEWVFHPPCLDGAAMSEVRSLYLRGYSWPLSRGEVGVFLENRQPLVELSEARNQWVSDLAHELRTPLTSIRLVAEALQGRLKAPELRWIEKLLTESNRLIDLVEDWLELSNLEKNPSQSLTFQPVELRSLIQSVWQTLEPLAAQKQLTLAYSGLDTLWLTADAARLTQVFLNLFDNSIKHSPPREAIRVAVKYLEAEESSDEVSGDFLPYPTDGQPWQETGTPPENGNKSDKSDSEMAPRWATPRLANAPQSMSARRDRASIQIDIIDSGCGFSEPDLPHVFKRLYRGDVSRYRQQTPSERSQTIGGRGSGLGLAIVQQIVQAHNGTIKAQNHPETGGAWLQIKLPI